MADVHALKSLLIHVCCALDVRAFAFLTTNRTRGRQHQCRQQKKFVHSESPFSETESKPVSFSFD
jgi:hypothetical protein